MIDYCKYGFYTCSFIGQVDFCNTCGDGCNYQWNDNKYTMPSIFKYIKADSFFKDYLPNIKNFKHKIRRRNGRGNHVEFSEAEKEQIKKALKQLAKDLT